MEGDRFVHRANMCDERVWNGGPDWATNKRTHNKAYSTPKLTLHILERLLHGACGALSLLHLLHLVSLKAAFAQQQPVLSFIVSEMVVPQQLP